MKILSNLFGDFFGSVFWYTSIIKIKSNIFFFNKLIHLICYIRGVKIGKKVIFNGLPVIRRYPKSGIFIGHNCFFNSSKNSGITSLVKPCKFITLKEDSKIIFGNNVGITGSLIIAASKIEICNNVLIGANCTFIDTDFHPPDPNARFQNDIMPSRPIMIEDNVFIGFNCIILKGVTIGKNSIIGANSVVINNIPKNVIAIGNPCKLVIRKNWE